MKGPESHRGAEHERQEAGAAPYPERMPVTEQHVGSVLSSTSKRWREFLLHVETDQYGNTNAYLQRQRTAEICS